MEQKADKMLDEVNAMAELENSNVDEAEDLEAKYSNVSTSVDEEIEKMKREMGL